MGHLYLCRKLVHLAATWDLVVVMVPEALALYRPFPFWFVFSSDKSANCRSGLGSNKTTRHNSEQCREQVGQNSYKVVQMLLFVAVTRSISRRHRTHVAKTSYSCRQNS